jgi:cell division protein FtsQ
MKISKIGIFFISLFISLIVGYMGYAIWCFSDKDKDIVCKELNIVFTDKFNIELISKAEISKIIENKELNPLGSSFRKIHTESIEDLLLQNPMIKKVECYKTPSGKIQLEIEQRIPKFIIAGHECFYIDTERKIIPISLSNSYYLPVVSGRVTHSFAKGKLFDFVSFIEKNPFWNAQIEQIFVLDDLSIELIPRVGDAVIYLGKLENYEVKLNNLYQLYKQGFNVIGWNRFKRIDLQYKNQIVCLKNEAEPKKLPVDIVQSMDSIDLKKL